MAHQLTVAIMLLISAVVAVILSRSSKETWKVWIGVIIGAILGVGFTVGAVYIQLVYALAQF